MPFRDDFPSEATPRLDPLARFFELEAAFEAGRGVLGDKVPLRLVAANMVLSEGPAQEIAAQVHRVRDELGALLPNFSHVSTPIQLLIAAILVQRGDSPAAFWAEVERVRGLMRELGMRRMQIYEIVAILALRVRVRLAPITTDQVRRMQAIYEAMKVHHWFLTGPEDYPACAFLAASAGQPEDIAARANAIYEGLRARAKLWRGDPLQTASNVLSLSPLEPSELVERFAGLTEAFAAAGLTIRQGEYDEVATLSFLARPQAAIVETVHAYVEAIRERLRWTDRGTGFGLGANLAFVRLVGDDPELGALADAKVLLDMQTIIAARAAAAAAAAAGAA